MAKQQKTYTREFKVEAVQLVKGSGKPLEPDRARAGDQR
jgi:transposase-like protein